MGIKADGLVKSLNSVTPVKTGVQKSLKLLDSGFRRNDKRGKTRLFTSSSRLFDERIAAARRRYHEFVEKGISMGQRKDLTGGGLIRSMGGWAAVKSMRKAKIFEKSDERILGNGDFVDQVLSVAEEQLERKNLLISKGYNLKITAERVCSVMDLEPSEIWKIGKSRRRVDARSLLCFWAVRELGLSMTELSRRLNLSLTGVSQSVTRGEKIAEINGFKLLDKKL